MRTDDILQSFRKSALFILIIFLEIVYLLASLFPVAPVLRAILAFPCLYIIPGFVLLVTLGGTKKSLTKLVILGFFISTVMMVVISSLFMALKLAQIPLSYSSTMVLLVLPLTLFSIIRKREIQTTQVDSVLVASALLLVIPLLWYFSQLPRFFAPDETTYISHALLGILDIGVPPAQNLVMPDTGVLMALIQGRYFWIYLLLSFVASTGLNVLNAGLLGIFFLVMIALASSFLVENKWLRFATFGVVLINPLLFIFSATALNDLAIAFYAVFAALFFVKAFQKTNTTLSISTTSLFFALLGVIIIAFVKINILIIVGMWLILIVVLVRYKLYRINLKYKLLLIAAVLPVLIYELCLDIPYVISQRILGNQVLAGVFEQFLFISPASKITNWFIPPLWDTAAPTLFTRTSIEYIEYFYTLLSPETLGLLFSVIILVLPILILSRNMHRKIRVTLLSSLVIISFYLYYFDSLSLIVPSDINRYSLWMIPLWIPLTFMVLQDFKDSPRMWNLLLIITGMFILLHLNTILVYEQGGILVGYALQYRLWTTGVLIIQLLSFTLILSLLFFQTIPINTQSIVRFQKIVKIVDIKTAALTLMLLILVLNSAFFNAISLRNTSLYHDHGFAEINEVITDSLDGENLVFSNNYIFMRPYVDNTLFSQGLFLPPPDTKEEFLSMLQVIPNNSLVLISDDSSTTLYEYANTYIKQYAYVDFITPEVNNLLDLTNLNLTTPNLVMSFDDANETTVLDQSGFENHGQNYGAEPTVGLVGNSLQFKGTGYVSVPDISQPNLSITISFFALFDTDEPVTNHIIISKGYAPSTGSFTIFLYAGWIYFSLGGIASHGIRAAPYLGTWHHYIFTYDGEKMEILVDGSPMASKPASGEIRDSPYDLEIGRDSEHQNDYFIGQLDSLQVSYNTLNYSAMIELFFSYYASRVQSLSLPNGRAGVFRVFKEVESGGSSINITETAISVDDNRTVQIRLFVGSAIEVNITLLIATERFTKVYTTPLVAGLNYLELEFEHISDPIWRGVGDPYWRHMSQVRLIVLENGTLIHSILLLVHNPVLMNTLLLSVFLGLLVVSLVLTSIKQKTMDTLRKIFKATLSKTD